MIDNEAKRLAHAINDLRPDWPISSLTTFFAKHAQIRNRPYRDVAVAMVWVATDMAIDGTWASKTPRRVLEDGPWWQQVVASGAGGRARPPKRDEECPLHPGQHLPPYCAGCRSEQLERRRDQDEVVDDGRSQDEIIRDLRACLQRSS